MAAGATYEPIATTTVSGSSASDYTFSSIPGTYTDLVLVCNVQGTGSDPRIGLQFNSDTGTNYSCTYLLGDGSSASSARASNRNQIDNIINIPAASAFGNVIYNIQNYANTTTYKTTLFRQNVASLGAGAEVALWRSTSAISTIRVWAITSGAFNVGSTFTLYGIASA